MNAFAVHFAVVAIAALASGCQGKSSAAVGGDASAPVSIMTACAPAPVAPASASRPDLRAARVTSLTRRASSIADVAPGRPEGAEHPAGTVYVAAVLDTAGHRGEATMFEWDVASASPLEHDGALLYRESDKEENGRSTSASPRRARTRSSPSRSRTAASPRSGRPRSITICAATGRSAARTCLPRGTSRSRRMAAGSPSLTSSSATSSRPAASSAPA